MGTAMLASPERLFQTQEERASFEQARRPVALFREISRRYKLRRADWGALLAYLLRHRDVIAVLLDAPERIRTIFGQAELFLDFLSDPESEGWEELLIVVRTRLPVDQALGRLRQLDATWFTEASRPTHFAVGVTVEPDV